MSESPDVTPPIALPAPAPEPKLSRTERRVEAVANAMRSLVRDLYSDLFPAALVPESLRFELHMNAAPANGWALTFDPPLEQQLVTAFEDQEAGQAALSAGRMFSYRDETLVPPPTARHVFKGYDSFGAPEWCEFAQALIDARHPEVDRIYAERPPQLCLLQYGRDLKARQLSSFGKSSKTYSVLGQVVIGYLSVPPCQRWALPERDRIAITFQVVEGRDARGSTRLRINTLCGPADPGDVEDVLSDKRHAWVRRARDIASAQLDEINRQVLLARARQDGDAVLETLRGTGRILRDIARHLERGDRQSRHRTVHAEHRRQADRRPVDKAWADAMAATAERCFFDEPKGTFVVWGRHNRATSTTPTAAMSPASCCPATRPSFASAPVAGAR
jgi:hypothetical protein